MLVPLLVDFTLFNYMVYVYEKHVLISTLQIGSFPSILSLLAPKEFQIHRHPPIRLFIKVTKQPVSLSSCCRSRLVWKKRWNTKARRGPSNPPTLPENFLLVFANFSFLCLSLICSNNTNNTQATEFFLEFSNKIFL